MGDEHRDSAAAPPSGAGAASNTVLVVEDEPVMNQLVCEIVRFQGFDSHGALSGEEALEYCQDRLPAAVLLDIMLPGISGYEVCHRLKCTRRTNLVPVVMLTALDQRDDRVRGIRIGADAYVTKPFEPEALVEQLARTVEHVRSRVASGVQGHVEVTFQSELRYLTEVNDLLLGLYANSPLSDKQIQEIRFCLLELGKDAIEWGREHGVEQLLHVDYTLGHEALELRVRDRSIGALPDGAAAEGAGRSFIRDQRDADPRGGSFAMSQKLMDEIRWNDEGSEVILTKRFAPSPSA